MCSGHGVCQSQARFVAAAGIKTGTALHKYATAFDAEKSYGCKCDTGYRSADCSKSACGAPLHSMSLPGRRVRVAD
jgi:hypothetical protein